MWYGRHSPGSSLRGRYLPGNIPPSSWSCAAAAKSLQSCLTLCNPIDGSSWWPGPWDSPGKNTGVGCHFLLQCMTVKSESEVAQSCPTLCDPVDGSPPGSAVPGILQVRTRVGSHFLLQCMKVKSESEVAQSCPTLSDPMDCSPPDSFHPWDFPGKSTGVGCHCLLPKYWSFS